MFKDIFYRNVRARDLLDAFLVSAVSSLLLVRFYLYVTGYPQIGSGALHIAHMLYGGLFMLVAMVMMLSFLGIRVRQAAAVIGGIGFGIFIDELGKFITEDNNYFFRPTIGLIYALFVILYLLFNFLTRSQKLTSREYQLNILTELEEAITHDMDKAERARLLALLDAADGRSPITKHLRQLADSLDVTAIDNPSRLHRFFRKIDRVYAKFWRLKGSHVLIRLLFIAEIVILAGATIYTIYNNANDVRALFDGIATYGEELLIGQIISSAVAVGFVLFGLSKLASSRLDAFEQFKRAALVNIYLVEFFVFIRLQFEALPGLVLNLLLLLLISFVIRQEIRLGARNVRT